jgi:hypothetical protein
MSLFDSASICITPNGVKEGKLYSIKPTDGSGDLSVTRATTATRVNSAGLVEVVPYNLFTYSQDFSNANWSKLNTTFSSDTLTASAGSATKLIFQNQITQGSQTVFFDVEYVSQQWIQIGVGTGASDIGYVNFNIQNKTIGTQGGGFVGSIVDYGTYVRIIVNINTTDKTSVFLCFVDSGTSSRADSTSSTGAIKLYKSQLVQGSSAKDYYPTTTRLNIPRLDYTNGSCPSILVEPQRTNLSTHSENMGDASWQKYRAIITDNVINSPSGILNADKFIATSTLGTHELVKVSTTSTATVYTRSVFVKVGEYNTFEMYEVNSAKGQFFNLLTQTISAPLTPGVSSATSSKIENFGNGWFKCSITYTSVGLVDVLVMGLYNGSLIFTGDNTSGLYVWGAQLEAGSYSTSLIPTQNSSVTRNSDQISKTGISSLIGQTEGTIFTEIKLQNVDSNSVYAVLSSGSFANSILIGKESGVTPNKLLLYINASGTNILNNTSISLTSDYIKCAIAYKSGNWAAYVNGNLIASGSSTFSFSSSLDRFGFANDGAVSVSIDKIEVKSATLWKERLTNEQLAQLTTI